MKDEVHLMIDLETLSLAPTAAIHEIGWALFSVNDDIGQVRRSGHVLVDPADCMRLGMDVDWSTIQWWLTQDEEARKKMALPGVFLVKALLDFTERALGNLNADMELVGVWGHGASFDIPILDNAYRIADMKTPWSHRIVRDTRTLFSMIPDTVWPENKVKHSAEHDAIAQAGAVQDAMQKFKKDFTRNPV
jgi:hypothetical protein